MMNIKQWKLKNKIILHLVVIGVLTAFILIFLYIKTQKNVISTMSREKAELVGSMIENSIYSAMEEGKNEHVRLTLEDVASSRGIKKIRILSPEGIVLRSSNNIEKGMSAEKKTLDKMGNLVNKDKSDIIIIDQKSTIQSLRTIKNKSECFRCHDPKNKIVGIVEVNIDYTVAASLIQKSQIQGIIIGFSALMILTFIVFRLFEKLINRPISQLKNRMKKVQRGDLNIELHTPKKDEIGSLTKSFNVMVRNLKEADYKIEKLYHKQMEKAEHLASIGELAAGLAHEIKNPIAGMKGALEIINQKADEQDPKKEIFTEMLLQIERINNTVQDLLSYAKPKEMSISLVDPNDCIQNAIKLATPQINSKKIHFHFKGLENNARAYLDADKIQALILNLILNSISAIEKEGNISIELHKRNKQELEIKFSDDGEGIKKEHLLQIFHPFFTTKSRGTGLGLSICKKIIDAHYGSIEVKSEEKKGTLFTIQLPALQPEE
ncbi:MAG: HAMP domain-containing protein [Candidatus Aminicenantes bacterium]|nr:MAG: HAMP domain-containing protein [Candidatus Aminicenantes bacterium]